MMKTVWAKDSMPRVPNRFRPIFTVFLPLVDLLFILFGIAGAVYGSKTVDQLTVGAFGIIWAIVMGAASLVAGVGLVFLLHRVELGAKIGMLTCLAVYSFLLFVGGAPRPHTGGLTIALLFICILVVAIRAFDLIGEIALDRPRAS